MPEPIEALLFDLGGVVIHNDIDRIFTCWASHANCDVASFRGRAVFDEPYKRYERGQTEIEDYFRHLRTLLGIDISDAQFLEGWNSIFVGEMPGISGLLKAARAKVPLYAFTNTNRAHEVCWRVQFADVLSHFTEIFVSSTIGLRKPDAAAYDHVVKAIGVPAGRILFFDDVLENIEGAEAHGLQAVQVRTTHEVEAALAGIVFAGASPPLTVIPGLDPGIQGGKEGGLKETRRI